MPFGGLLTCGRILGRAQRRYETTISALFVMSSHVHMLLVVDDAKEPAAFMRYVNSKLAREVNRLTGWRGPVFDRRYEMTVVTNEDAAQSRDCGMCSAKPFRPIWSSG